MRYYLTVLAIIAALPLSEVNADLVGDTVDFAISIPLTLTQSSAVVGPGVESQIQASSLPFWDIDVGSSTVSLTSVRPNPFGINPPAVLTISDLDWVGQPGVVTGFTLTNNTVQAGFTASDISTTADSVTIDLGTTTWAPGNNATITLQTAHVPEPSSFLLVGFVGLTFFTFRHRRGGACHRPRH